MIPKEELLDTASGRLAAKIWQHESSAGIPLLAVHGWMDNAASFDALIPQLHRGCEAIDLAGHGFSDHRVSKAYHFVDYVFDVFAYVKARGWQQVDLIGHSLGGAVVSLLAASCPELVRSVVVLDSLAGPMSGALENSAAQLGDYMQNRLHALTKLPRSKRAFSSIEEAMHYRVQASVVPIAVEPARPIVERSLRKVDEGWVWSHDPALKISSAQRFSEPQVHALLAKVACPYLAIEADPGLADARARSLQDQRFKAIYQGERVIVPGSHYFHFERPAEIASCARSFWTKI